MNGQQCLKQWRESHERQWDSRLKRDKDIVSYGGGVEVENIVKWDKRDCLVWGWRQISNETRRLSRMGVRWRWRILSSRDKRAHLVWRCGGENFLTRQARLSRMGVGWRWRILSNETSELISFGGGEYFVASKRDCLIWGWGRDTLHTILMTSHT